VEYYRRIWEGVAQPPGPPLMDMTEETIALRPDFFPVAEFSGTRHPGSQGYAFRAFLLARELIRQKVVPLQAP